MVGAWKRRRPLLLSSLMDRCSPTGGDACSRFRTWRLAGSSSCSFCSAAHVRRRSLRSSCFAMSSGCCDARAGGSATRSTIGRCLPHFLGLCLALAGSVRADARRVIGHLGRRSDTRTRVPGYSRRIGRSERRADARRGIPRCAHWLRGRWPVIPISRSAALTRCASRRGSGPV
jgi:hypothetical protein